MRYIMTTVQAPSETGIAVQPSNDTMKAKDKDDAKAAEHGTIEEANRASKPPVEEMNILTENCLLSRLILT